MVSFSGTYTSRRWIQTGLTSLDIACSRLDRGAGVINLGIPTRIGIHLYAATKVGKSHVALSLSAIIAEALGKSLVFAPIDTFDLDAAEDIVNEAGLTRAPAVVMEDTDEKVCDELVAKFASSLYATGVLDSVFAISPIAEQEGSVGDANMGRRAKMMSAWVKQMFKIVSRSKDEKVFFAINHLTPTIGPTPGNTTSGGKAIPGHTSIHMKLTRSFPKIESNNGWLIEGIIEQANFIPHGRCFNLYVEGGMGIHKGLTAVFDCLMFGLAQKDKSGFVKMGDVRVRLSTLMNNPEDKKSFEPFIKALEDNKRELSEIFVTKETKAKAKKAAAAAKIDARSKTEDELNVDEETGEVLGEEISDAEIAAMME